MWDYTFQGLALTYSPYDNGTDAKRSQIDLTGHIIPYFEMGNNENAAHLRQRIMEAAALDIDVLEAMEKALDFQKVKQATADALRVWADTAGEGALLKMAKEVKEAAEKPTSTNNVWTDSECSPP